MNGLEAYKWIESRVNEYKKKQNIQGDLWYRGEKGTFSKMLSSMVRSVFGNEPDMSLLTPSEQEMIQGYERWIYNKFAKHMLTEHPSGYIHQPLDNWDIVYFLQHHGLSTRFLDWTDDLNVSIYFSGGENKKETGEKKEEIKNTRIWILDPVKFNELSIGVDGITTPSRTYEEMINTIRFNAAKMKPAAISPEKPRFVNERLYKQRGYFVFTGLGDVCLREYISHLAEENGVSEDSFFTSIEIPYEIVKLAQGYISNEPSININKGTLGLRDEYPLQKEYTFEYYNNSLQVDRNSPSNKFDGGASPAGRW